MKMKFGIVLFSVVALCACGSNEGGNKSNGSATKSATPADPKLAEEVRSAADMLKAQLPIRQPNGVTFTGVEAKGTELILDMQVAQDVDQAKFEQMEKQLPLIACGNAQAQEMFRRGGTYTYRISGTSGEQFTASVNSCPS